ncbi:sideroflexin-2 [Bombus impatiens]|uniref:Sideroflexin-2 n=1 Tax=Bombus impatiens TaxID=132113 RepID=A0A6P3DPN6_BOMIM|nr:sideroflexin-2 [Bombus impatiens]
MNVGERIDIDKPLWDQSTYIGRLKHFAFITDCRMIFVNDQKLREAKQFCDDYKRGNIPPGTRMSDVIRAKQLRDGAFHPQTGELVPVVTRLSFQMPTSVILTASMLACQKSTLAIIIIQAVNQIHNAIVNDVYKSKLNGDDKSVKKAYLCAVATGSIMTICCKRILAQKSYTFTRCLPFCAVTTGHIINLPVIRYKEITTGIPIYMKDKTEPFMKSKVAAVKSICECLVSRIAMSIPCFLLIPIITQKLMPYCFSQHRPWILIPIQTGLCAIGCIFAIPSALAIFPERNSMSPILMKLYPSEYEEFKEHAKEHIDKVYYNKGI